MTKKPNWLPDWKDDKQYKDHGDDLTMWAWEFLRRNPEYQADWNSLGCAHTSAPYSTDPDNPELLIDVRLTGNREAEQLGKKWKLFHGPIEDPAHNRPVGIYAHVNSEAPLVFWQECPEEGFIAENYLSKLKDEKNAAVFIDLDRSIDGQLKAVARNLKRIQTTLIKAGKVAPTKAKARVNVYNRYLRILDATAAGVHWKEIVMAIEPHRLNMEGVKAKGYKRKAAEDFIEDSLKAARALVSGGYCHIAQRVKPKKRRGK